MSGSPTPEDWEKHREIIENYYLRSHTNGKHTYTLGKILKLMAEEHGFYAKKAQYKTRISKWGLWRNISKRMARSMAQIQDKRANVDGKRTAFVLCGVPISENKVKRARENHDYGVDLGLTYIRDVVPSQIGYFTPEPQDELYEAIKYKGLNEDGYMMVNGMEGAARGTDSQDSYDGDSQDSIEISDDWTNITREELEPRRANPETDSIEPIYEGDRELKDNMPSLVGWPVENLELSTELIGMHGSSFIGMITSTHHDLHSDLAYTGILEAEGDRNIIKSTELRGCVWMSSGWNGRGFMGNLFDDEYDVVLSESWPFGATDYSSQETLRETRRELLIHQAMSSSIL